MEKFVDFILEKNKSVKAPKGFHWMKKGSNYKLMKHDPKSFKPHKNASLEADFEVQSVQSVHEVYKDSGLGKWFGKGGKGGKTKGGWDRYNTKGEKIGKCGDKKKGEGKPKCLSAEKAAKMTKKERANAVKRKRKSDPDTDRPGTGNKPINVSNRIKESFVSFTEYITEASKNVPTNPALWSKAKSAARSKFDVYPSAYANAWASKWYKKRGGGWKKKKS